MKPINPYPHGILDYLVALLLVVSPWLLGFAAISATATTTMVFLGIVVFVLSILTDYPLGLIKVVPFRTHGVIETIGALFLLISPWLLGFNAVSGTATITAVVVSIVYLIVVALTNYTVRTERPVT